MTHYEHVTVHACTHTICRLLIPKNMAKKETLCTKPVVDGEGLGGVGGGGGGGGGGLLKKNAAVSLLSKL